MNPRCFVVLKTSHLACQVKKSVMGRESNCKSLLDTKDCKWIWLFHVIKVNKTRFSKLASPNVYLTLWKHGLTREEQNTIRNSRCVSRKIVYITKLQWYMYTVSETQWIHCWLCWYNRANTTKVADWGEEFQKIQQKSTQQWIKMNSY